MELKERRQIEMSSTDLMQKYTHNDSELQSNNQTVTPYEMITKEAQE